MNSEFVLSYVHKHSINNAIAVGEIATIYGVDRAKMKKIGFGVLMELKEGKLWAGNIKPY